MPFLRRRGVLASETDIRRHTTILESSPVETTSPPSKSLLSPESAAAPGSRDGSGQAAGSGDRNGARPSSRGTLRAKMSLESTAASANRASGDPYDRPESPPIQEETPKHRRFSMLRFRNASDSQLSARAKIHQQQHHQQQQRGNTPPVPQLPPIDVSTQLSPPSIITTAPTMEANAQSKKSRMKMPVRLRQSADVPRDEMESAPTSKLKTPLTNKKERRKSMNEHTSRHTVTFRDSRNEMSSTPSIEEADERSTTLPVSQSRKSDLSKSDLEPGSQGSGKASTFTSNSGSAASSFFRLKRRPKQPEPLFPISHLQQQNSQNKTPISSAAGSNTSLITDAPRPSTGHDKRTPVASPSHGHGPGLLSKTGSPATALFRPGSQNSGQSSPTRTHLGLRGRSSTLSSMGRTSTDDHQPSGTTRTSSSTGRKSFGDLLGLSRGRHDGTRPGALTPATPGSNTSKNNSLQLPREPVVLPERREEETPAKYLARVEELFSRGVIAAALSKGTDQFSAAVLRSYMRTFGFFEEPMDMAIRKLLMEAELPKETQQIDRCLQAFANRYHECNPGVYSTPDQAYFIAFSLLILHTDVFNKNNKYKMQKSDYLKNTHGEGIFDDILECFYDNISYTPFIHVEDEVGIHAEHSSQGSKKKHKNHNPNHDSLRRNRDPIDPYTLIIDGKLDVLRPPLKDQIPLEEYYNYLGTSNRLNLKELQKTFFKTGVLQIVSARSRPDAFMNAQTASNPQEAHVGIVDIKVTKVGLLWRKDPKKKKTRSPWQEWGAILTGAQLYFFRNTNWIKSLMHQYDAHIKSGNDGTPLIFNPPLENFKPDALMSTEGAVALWDTSYKKHKSSFVYVRHGGMEEVLLAPSDEDRNDWLAKLNYAAAFRTSGVRMRGLVGGNYEGQSRRAIRRADNGEATQLIQTPTGDVSINRGRIDHQMARDILVARRDVLKEKITESEDQLIAAQKQLDTKLRNARHLLLLAPIQDKTRDQVRLGAARIMAQLKWSRIEIWRLKCHRDILSMDLEEDRQVNGDLAPDENADPDLPRVVEASPLAHKSSKTSTRLSTHGSPRSRPAPSPDGRSSEFSKSVGRESPVPEQFKTPPAAPADTPSKDVPALGLDRPSPRRPSMSSAGSSRRNITSPPLTVSAVSSPSSRKDHDAEHDESDDEDAGERQVLEQAGLLDVDPPQQAENRPGSAVTSDEASEHRKLSVNSGGTDKDRLERTKVRRSLQRTLRDGAGHLSHHRSKRGKDSASSAGVSDELGHEDMLSRGTGSFTVHGKKASIVNFGEGLQQMTSDDRIKQRKSSQHVEDSGMVSPVSADEDFHSVASGGEVSEGRGRRGSATSASTATARSFRELHRKYSASKTQRSGLFSGLTVPSDDDSDAAVSFSDGRRTPLPPLDDEDEDPSPEGPRRSLFFTPEPPDSPADPAAAMSGMPGASEEGLPEDKGAVEEDEEDDKDETGDEDSEAESDDGDGSSAANVKDEEEHRQQQNKEDAGKSRLEGPNTVPPMKA